MEEEKEIITFQAFQNEQVLNELKSLPISKRKKLIDQYLRFKEKYIKDLMFELDKCKYQYNKALKIAHELKKE